MRSNVVYRVTCTCGAKYIGQTRRNIYTRMEEHAKTSGSGLTAVGQHISENAGHTVNTDDPDILACSPYFSTLILKESLFIQKEDPSLNVQRDTRCLYLFKVK